MNFGTALPGHTAVSVWKWMDCIRILKFILHLPL